MTRIVSHWTLLIVLSMLPASALAQGTVDDERPPGEDGESRPRVAAEETSEPLAPLQPYRVRATLGGGVSLRFVNDIDFGQSRWAPAFLDLAGQYIFAGRSIWRHGVGLSISANLSGDGYANSSLGVNAFAQTAITPHYMAYFRLDDSFILTAHAGPNLVLGSPSFTLGAEVGVSFAYMFTAGLGAYVEATSNVWFGAQDTIHPTASGEIGVVMDFEVLP